MLVKSFVISIILCLTNFYNSGDQITGKWISVNTDGEKGIVKIYRAKNGLYYGKLIRAYNDEYNKQLQDKEKPVFVLKEFEYKGNNKYSGGYVIRPKFEDSYNGKIILEDKNTLKVTASYAIFSKSVYWKRYK